MNEVKKVILFLLCCAIPFSFYVFLCTEGAPKCCNKEMGI